MCIASGAMCTQGSSVCCAGLACGAQPGGTFCCRPAMGTCTAGRECCGSMLCTGGRCVCRRGDETCTEDTDCCGGARCQPIEDGGTIKRCACGHQNDSCTSNEGCCGGLECRGGRCLIPGCNPPGEMCGVGDASECCSGFLCQAQPSGSQSCCRFPSLTSDGTQVDCHSGAECCGFSPCSGGHCVCQRAGGSCMNSLECCGGMLCDRPDAGAQGTCRCQARGQFCIPNGNDCCPGTTCTNNTCQ